MKTAAAVWFCTLAIAVAPAVAGCASDPLPLTTTTGADLGDPNQVIANAMATMFTWNPARDSSADIAFQRASVYMSGDLAAQSKTVAPPGPGSQWDQWRTSGAQIGAKVYFVADETPPNSDSEVHRVVVIVQSALTADNRLIDEIRHTAWVTANKSNNGWRVTGIQF